MSLFQAYMDKNFTNSEGDRGVRSLAKLCRALGYKDPQGFGQIEGGACYGDIFAFLQDNSGAIEAIVEYVERGESVWKEELSAAMQEDAKWWIVEDEEFIAEGSYETKEDAEEALKSNPDDYSESAFVGFGLDRCRTFIPVDVTE